MKCLLKGGTVVSATETKEADILLEGEKILQVGKDIRCEEVKIEDVSGCLLFPGFIDGHTHFDLHVAGTVTADDFYTGTKAALLGGTTTIIDFATQYHGETLMEGLSNWQKKTEGKCSCDYGFHMSISDWNEQTSKDLVSMKTAGITSFKLYMTYDTQVSDKDIYEVLRCMKAIGGLVGVHCENSGLIAGLQAEYKAAGKLGVLSHAKTRPIAAEAEAINRLLRIAQVADVPVMIVHLTSAEGLKVIEEARARGQKVYAETCPQYLLMDDSCYDLPGVEGAKYVIAPPLRKKENQEVLWAALRGERIQTIATDHCSFTTTQKELGKDDFTKIPGGMPGVETRGMLLYTYGVRRGRITLSQMCKFLSENPAKLYGMYPKKGVLLQGSDADIVVVRPGVKETITAKRQMQHVDYAPFEGYEVEGKIEQVYVRGQLVVRDGKVVKEKAGKYVNRKETCDF